MKYTVVWSPVAESDLAKLWMASSQPASIADAANLLDRALADSADTLGESRSGGRRIAFCVPLVIDFEFEESDRMAYVLAVREITSS
jgi:plasmid stabilization system protein ParE